MPRRRRHHRPDRQTLVARFHSSGLSRRAFSEAHGVPLSTLSYWLRKEPALIPVRLAEPRASGPLIEIRLPKDIVVRIAGDGDPEILASILRAAVSAC